MFAFIPNANTHNPHKRACRLGHAPARGCSASRSCMRLSPADSTRMRANCCTPCVCGQHGGSIEGGVCVKKGGASGRGGHCCIAATATASKLYQPASHTPRATRGCSLTGRPPLRSESAAAAHRWSSACAQRQRPESGWVVGCAAGQRACARQPLLAQAHSPLLGGAAARRPCWQPEAIDSRHTTHLGAVKVLGCLLQHRRQAHGLVTRGCRTSAAATAAACCSSSFCLAPTTTTAAAAGPLLPRQQAQFIVARAGVAAAARGSVLHAAAAAVRDSPIGLGPSPPRTVPAICGTPCWQQSAPAARTWL